MQHIVNTYKTNELADVATACLSISWLYAYIHTYYIQARSQDFQKGGYMGVRCVRMHA